VVYRDRELAMVRLRAFGKFAIRVANPQLFANTLTGTLSSYSTDAVESYFKDVIVARFTDLLGENLQSIFDLPKVYDELAMGLKARVAEDFGKFGIDLVDLFLGAITPPEEVQKMIDERSGMGALGNLDAYMKFKAARALGDAAQQQGGDAGGLVGAGLGVGVGAGLGSMLPGMMQQAIQGQSSGAAPAAPQGGGAPAAGAAGAAAGAGAGSGEGTAPEAGGAKPAFCAQCGTKLPENARFCPGCGTKVGE
jgi:membrane protease subunit (stomatin/prohibitin family)